MHRGGGEDRLESQSGETLAVSKFEFSCLFCEIMCVIESCAIIQKRVLGFKYFPIFINVVCTVIDLFLFPSLIGWGQIRRGMSITPTVDDD